MFNFFPAVLIYRTATFIFLSDYFFPPVMSPEPRPSASANISFKAVDKATAFSCRVTLASTAVIIFLFLSMAGKAEALERERKQHPHLTNMETNTKRVFPD